MAAVSNTSPLLRFTSIERLDLLGRVFGEVIVPPAAWTEIVTTGGHRPGAAEVARAPWIRQQSPIPTALLARLTQQLGLGEAEAIALANEFARSAPLLIDDRQGRRIARELGLPVVGSAGVLLLAKEAGLIPHPLRRVVTVVAGAKQSAP